MYHEDIGGIPVFWTISEQVSENFAKWGKVVFFLFWLSHLRKWRWNMICSCALLRPIRVLIFWLRLGSTLVFPSFPPLLGAIVGLKEFVTVSSFWELMMKPLSSLRYTSHLCMLTKIQNPSVTRIRYVQIVFARDMTTNMHVLMLWDGPIMEGIRTNGFFNQFCVVVKVAMIRKKV